MTYSIPRRGADRAFTEEKPSFQYISAMAAKDTRRGVMAGDSAAAGGARKIGSR